MPINQISQAFRSLAQTVLGSFASVIVLLAILFAVQNHPQVTRMERWARLNGIGLGAVSIVAMMLPIAGPPTNLCVVPLLLAAPAFGLGAGLTAAIAAMIGQALLPIAWNGITVLHIATSAGIGFLAAWSMGWRGIVLTRARADFRLVHVALLALLSPLAALAPALIVMGHAIPGSVTAWRTSWAESMLLVLVATAVASLIIVIYNVRYRSEQALDDANEQLRNMAANIPGLIFRRALGPNGEPIFHYVSDRCEAILGVPPEALIESTDNLMALVHPDDVAYLRGVQRSALYIEDRPLISEFRIIRPDGQIRWLQSRSQVNHIASAKAGETIGDGIAFDITEQKEGAEAQKRLAWVAEHDPLTGCLDRGAFEVALKTRTPPSKDREEFLIFLNLRDSRRVNELFGQTAGDRRIAETARRLRATVPEDSIVARWGGDEFAVYGTLPAGNQAPTDRIRNALGRLYWIHDQPVPIHADFGSVLSSVAGTDTDKLIRSAGSALDEARRAETPTVIEFTTAFDSARIARNRLDNEIAEAVEQEAFSLGWQPIIAVADRQVLGHEILARWRTADGRWIAPSVFVPRIEAHGLWPAFDEWVLRTSCLAAMQRPLSGWISVNLSAGWFSLGDLVSLVKRVLSDTQLPADRLYLEITERVLIEDFAAASKVISALKDINVSVVIDDFGSTYSSLSYIYSLPVDKVKIDKSFIDNLATDTRLQAIVRRLISLFRELDIECVAEGVETQAQMDLLTQFECSAIQGYLTGRPELIHEAGSTT